MHYATLFSLLPLLVSAQETVLGVYIFHRHGDRTSKSTPPANLTDLGYAQVFESGDYYRQRYVASNATSKINGLNTDLVKQSQIAVSSPADVVLQNSAAGFTQALYPPVGTQLGQETLRNSTVVQTPMSGFQLVPISIVGFNGGSEDNGWLQAATGCANAISSSNQYYYTPEYMSLLNSTADFYDALYPVVNRTFTQDYMSFKNAYTIYDLINVAQIHNASIQSDDIITNGDTFSQLQTLADQHEFNLAYNASSNIRGIAGMQLAAQAVQYLNSTISGAGSKNQFGIQFGAYGTMLSYFGLAGLAGVNGSQFYGVPDYASALVWELYTNVSVDPYPSTDDMYVRFLFKNGSSSVSAPPQVYPLFGTNQNSVSWNDFTAATAKFSVSSTQQWCTACGNTTGNCAQFANTTSSSDESSNNGSGMSNAVAGVIGAFVTLGVILLLELALILLGGLRLVRKNRLVAGRNVANGGSELKA